MNWFICGLACVGFERLASYRCFIDVLDVYVTYALFVGIHQENMRGSSPSPSARRGSSSQPTERNITSHFYPKKKAIDVRFFEIMTKPFLFRRYEPMSAPFLLL